MKIDPVLSKAASLAKKKDFDGALRILKAEEDRYNGSFSYYYLYGVICLHNGNFVDALSGFRLARQIKMNDPSVMLGLASLYLKRMDTVQAVDYYLDVQEIDPGNKTAKKALDVIRKYSSSEALSDWLTPERLAKLFPPIPSPGITKRMVLLGSFALAAVLFVAYALMINFRVLQSPIKKPDARPHTEFILSGQERADPVETGGSYMYILTRDQATTLYDRALSLFTDYRDEAAKLSLNRILESNASESIKNKARLLFLYMEIPGFDNFKRNDNPSITEVKNEPVIYRDVYVIWSGMATNIKITDEQTSFQFLVGYDTRRTLEGLVPVEFKIPVSINPDRPLEVLGKILLNSTNTDISLEGVSIHQSGRLEN
jgi:tetratricopeptide (TPR) repeat protein